MKALLDSGVTLVVDRYAFSGAAYTGTKEGFDLAWCRTPDMGLPAPDCVVYLTLNPDIAATRGDRRREIRGHGLSDQSGKEFSEVGFVCEKRIYQSWIIFSLVSFQ